MEKLTEPEKTSLLPEMKPPLLNNKKKDPSPYKKKD